MFEGRFCHGMYCELLYMSAGFLCGISVDWVALSFYPIIERSSLGLVVVIGVCYMFHWSDRLLQLVRRK